MRSPDDPVAVAATTAVQTGDLEALAELLRTVPGLATDRIGDAHMSRTLLHAATDWPGNYPGGPEVVRLLVAHGADVNARFAGPHAETALHWAASSDDVAVLDALLDLGADIEADGAVIAGGTPLSDAVAFGNWAAARRLVARGATANLWEAAALGQAERVEELLPAAVDDDVHVALWCAAHGGQRAMCERLVAAGGNPAWMGFDDLTPAGAAGRSGHTELAAWLTAQTG